MRKTPDPKKVEAQKAKAKNKLFTHSTSTSQGTTVGGRSGSHKLPKNQQNKNKS